MNELYRIGEREPEPRRRRRLVWLIIILIIVLLLGWGLIVLRNHLKPNTVIKQAKATTTRIDYSTKTTHYDEPDFGIDIPATWKPLPRPPGPYQSFSWGNGLLTGDEQEIEIFEDSLPPNFPLNRVQIVQGEGDHLELEGSVSDNCATFTQNLALTNGEFGALAKWQNVTFLCDRSDQERNVIGISSSDGVNLVKLTSSNGAVHSLLLTDTNNSIDPDYTVFTAAIQSLRMK